MTNFVLALFAVTGAWGQSLEVTPSSVDRGSANIFRILLKAPAGNAPVALQWEITVHSEIIIDVSGIVTGDASEEAGKSLTCAAKGGSGTSRTFACVLAGGMKQIPEGPIAIVKYLADEKARPGSVTVRLEKAAGASVDLKKLAIADASGVITIH